MTVNIETDLKEILGQINQKLDTLQKDVVDLKIGQADIKGEIKALDERLSGQIKSVDERLSGQIKSVDERLSGKISTLEAKIDGLDKRVANQEFTNRGVLIGLIVAITGGVAKLFGFFPKP